MIKIEEINENKTKIYIDENNYGYINKNYSEKRMCFNYKIDYFYKNIYQGSVYKDTYDDAVNNLIKILNRINMIYLKSFENFKLN